MCDSTICHFMKRVQTNLLLFLFFNSLTLLGQNNKSKDYLLLFTDTTKDEYGYKNQKGDTVIKLGKYNFCFTDTFRIYAIVSNKSSHLVAIDRRRKVLYNRCAQGMVANTYQIFRLSTHRLIWKLM